MSDITIIIHEKTANGFLLNIEDFLRIDSSDIEDKYGEGSFVYKIENGIQIEIKVSDSCEVSEDDLIQGIKTHLRIP